MKKFIALSLASIVALASAPTLAQSDSFTFSGRVTNHGNTVALASHDAFPTGIEHNQEGQYHDVVVDGDQPLTVTYTLDKYGNACQFSFAKTGRVSVRVLSADRDNTDRHISCHYVTGNDAPDVLMVAACTHNHCL